MIWSGETGWVVQYELLSFHVYWDLFFSFHPTKNDKRCLCLFAISIFKKLPRWMCISGDTLLTSRNDQPSAPTDDTLTWFAEENHTRNQCSARNIGAVLKALDLFLIVGGHSNPTFPYGYHHYRKYIGYSDTISWARSSLASCAPLIGGSMVAFIVTLQFF